MVSVILGSSHHADVCSRVHLSDKFGFKLFEAIKMAPNDIKSTRWPHPYRGYFDFTSVQWDEADAGRPSLHTVCDLHPNF